MDKIATSKRRLGDDSDGGFVPGTPAERLAMMWPLTCEMASLSGKFDPDEPMRRDIAVLKRRSR